MHLLLNKKLSDQQLIEGLKAGGIERSRFQSKLYLRFDYMIRAGAKKYSLPEDRAASAYSETIMAVIKNIILDRFEGRSSLEGYVHGIFANKCIDEVRSEASHSNQSRKTVIIDEMIGDLPDSTADIIRSHVKKENWAILTGKIAELGKKCYDILLLWANHYKDQEIADMMSYSNSKVARITRIRCLKKMQDTTKLINLKHE